MIPKQLRDRYGLEKGVTVSIVAMPDGISILPEVPQRRFIKRGPLLIIETGAGPAPLEAFDVEQLRDQELNGKLS